MRHSSPSHLAHSAVSFTGKSWIVYLLPYNCTLHLVHGQFYTMSVDAYLPYESTKNKQKGK
jgi:hypothetical protein